MSDRRSLVSVASGVYEEIADAPLVPHRSAVPVTTFLWYSLFKCLPKKEYRFQGSCTLYPQRTLCCTNVNLFLTCPELLCCMSCYLYYVLELNFHKISMIFCPSSGCRADIRVCSGVCVRDDATWQAMPAAAAAAESAIRVSSIPEGGCTYD